MIDPKSLRIGNYVTIDNPTWWPALKDVPLMVTCIELVKNDRDFPNSTASINLAGPYETTYSQMNEFIKAIPLSENELIRLGFEKSKSEWQLFPLALMDSPNGYEYFHRSLGGGKFLKIQYVHQLQTLYFALTGEELTYNKAGLTTPTESDKPEPVIGSNGIINTDNKEI